MYYKLFELVLQCSTTFVLSNLAKITKNLKNRNTTTENIFQVKFILNFQEFNSLFNLFTALARIVCLPLASTSNSLTISNGETLNSQRCLGLPLPLDSPWVEITQPRYRHCFKPLATWLWGNPDFVDNCLILSDRLEESVATT